MLTDPEGAVAERRPHALRRLYDWVLSWAHTPYGSPALFVLAFAESSFFPIPPDVLQLALSAGRPRRSFHYAAIATAGSVLGGILGWLIGYALWESLSEFFFRWIPGFTRENFARVEAGYREHDFLFIFGAAFTPIPYKVFTIASGVFEVGLWTLVLASTLGRGARFFLVAGFLYFFGPGVKSLIERYFEWATLLLLVLGVGGFLAIKLLL